MKFTTLSLEIPHENIKQGNYFYLCILNLGKFTTHIIERVNTDVLLNRCECVKVQVKREKKSNTALIFLFTF